MIISGPKKSERVAPEKKASKTESPKLSEGHEVQTDSAEDMLAQKRRKLAEKLKASKKPKESTRCRATFERMDVNRLRLPGGNGRILTREDIAPSLEQLRDRLVAKNVAVEIAQRVCDSVAERLVGTPLGAFERVYTRVRTSLEEVCTRVLASGRRVDVLRDALDARSQGKPYTIVFCGVNGVGKSTNLAKIAFWLIEKNFRVLIAACDTFRSGAVEQLRTHVHKLNYIHPPEQHGGQKMVELYEQGYGRDAASIARSAINYAHATAIKQDSNDINCDQEHLIHMNQPDLVLFVGEALVGNEAVDQLVKFNQSLADHSMADKPRTIDGIVLTKFDTIDDKLVAPLLIPNTGARWSQRNIDRVVHIETFRKKVEMMVAEKFYRKFNSQQLISRLSKHSLYSGRCSGPVYHSLSNSKPRVFQHHSCCKILLTIVLQCLIPQVGAAISMAYISSQPIVFVGTGQTYADLRQLSVGAVVKALMK
ncbi:SRP54-type protein, GTPase domain protein [Opisthorchis viverrini]|uniref:SRP54-type protein, GTPase domain protein n=1 Tax=Opisthorchis viverrini TaxID=6198 RepID=A0A1S8WV73_OPIVI|nr:SRP54-type protein, GTPase domain protein [Opisthorchis viverrini]